MWLESPAAVFFSDFLVDFRDTGVETLVLRFKAEEEDDDVEAGDESLEADDILDGTDVNVSTSSSQNFFLRRSLLPETAARAGPSSSLGLILQPLRTFIGVAGVVGSLKNTKKALISY